MNKAQENSVQSLKGLYTIVVGLALSMAIFNVVDTTQGSIPIKKELLFPFLAFIATLIPFYHGALRHLDSTYIEKGGKQTRGGALLVDFTMLFIEACLLFAIAILLTDIWFFAWGLVVLLVFDVIWALLAHLAFTQNVQPKAELRWAFINIITAGILTLLYTLITDIPGTRLAICVFIIALIRTFFDYGLCWKFYLPTD